MKSRIAAVGLSALLVVGGGYWFGPRLIAHWRPPAEHNAARPEGVNASAAVEPTYIDVLPEVVELTGIRTAKATLPTRLRELSVSGELGFDPNRLVHVHARFPGQVVELATVEEPLAIAPGSLKVRRVVSFMDHVTKGQRLGVLWSKELGEKKSELVAALIRLRTDLINLERLNPLYEKGAIPERSLRDAEFNVDTDETKVESARWTLRSWVLTDEEIAEVEAEAERIHKERSTRSLGKIELEANWARVDIIAPIDGTIVEKNVVEDNLYNSDADLFMIADLSTLAVRGQVYEEDLPVLQSLPFPIPWKIHISSNPDAPPIEGTINNIGDIINPYTHMALVMGSVSNQEGRLFAGQFITASIQLPQEPDVVEIPTRGLVEDGNESVVLVKTDPKRDRFYRRRVAVVRRFHDFVHLRSRLTPEQKAQGFEELHEGELVVAAGALELKAALAAQQPDEDRRWPDQ
ncbi:MAG TPA: efflux RND transporter periplasmic adaptor subunit [Pirellulales bacterium]|nr:efflux RND transporter periplasmic adaptor subunit [Pirellulales bacterium]